MTAKELHKEFEKTGIKYAWLENAGGGVAYPMNRPGDNFQEHLQKIYTYLDSKAMPNGVYTICGGFSVKNRKGPRVEYMKGTLSESGVRDMATGDRMTINAPHFDIGQFIQLNADLASVKAENSVLKQQITRMEVEIDSLTERNRELMDKVVDGASMQQPAPVTFMDQLPKLMEAAAPFAPVLAAMLTKQQTQTQMIPAAQYHQVMEPAQPIHPMAPTVLSEPLTKTENDVQKNPSDDYTRSVHISRHLEVLFQQHPKEFDKFVRQVYETDDAGESGESDGFELSDEMEEMEASHD